MLCGIGNLPFVLEIGDFRGYRSLHLFSCLQGFFLFPCTSVCRQKDLPPVRWKAHGFHPASGQDSSKNQILSKTFYKNDSTRKIKWIFKRDFASSVTSCGAPQKEEREPAGVSPKQATKRTRERRSTSLMRKG